MGEADDGTKAEGGGRPLRRPQPQQTSLFGDDRTPKRDYCEVVVEANTRSLDRVLTYCIPKHLVESVHVGSYIRAPLGRRTVAGYVVKLVDHAPAVSIRPIIEKLSDEDPLGQEQVALAEFIAQRYRASLADCLRCFLPPGGSRKAQRLVCATDAGRGPSASPLVASAPNQHRTLEALREAEALPIQQLAKVFGGGRSGLAKATASVRALVDKGLAREDKGLRRPSARPRLQQAAALADGDKDWAQVAAKLRARAPRQAEVIQALLDADGEPVLVSGLSRGAVQALIKAGHVRLLEQHTVRVPERSGLGAETPPHIQLNPAQLSAVARVCDALAGGKTETLLLHGVTGSGKTEVYLRSITAAVDAGRSAIVLVPEIALTPQTVGRFAARFGERLALLHSALSVGERFDEWERIRRGEADIVIGARSAIFAPCRNVGVIVIDEAHERAYKQDAEPRYEAQVVAAQRAAAQNAVLILGTATPSVEDYHACQAADSPPVLVQLPDRVDDRPLPTIDLVDLRQEPFDARRGPFSEALLGALRTCISNGEQAMLFLNRRGFATFVMCRECGFSLRCPDCDVSLIYHHGTKQLRCHHCGHERPVPDQCENCEGYDIGFQGLGTERVADQVSRLLEDARVLRMDRDTTSRKGAYGSILQQFAAGRANILVGTQMIAKGHDFPNVTVVGVLNADTGLNRPDFRAAEQTFQLLTQVSGRAGRAERPGRVIVQTYNPEHYAIRAACNHDYGAFYGKELASRRANGYPPFTRLIKLGFADRSEQAALSLANRYRGALQGLGLERGRGDVQFLGPAEAPLHKLRGMYRYHMLLKGPHAAGVREALEALLNCVPDSGDTVVTVDIDPLDMM